MRPNLNRMHELMKLYTLNPTNWVLKHCNQWFNPWTCNAADHSNWMWWEKIIKQSNSYRVILQNDSRIKKMPKTDKLVEERDFIISPWCMLESNQCPCEYNSSFQWTLGPSQIQSVTPHHCVYSLTSPFHHVEGSGLELPSASWTIFSIPLSLVEC